MEYDYDPECSSGLTTIFGERFPDSLRSLPNRDRPSFLCAAGNLSLLADPSVMVCGARDASESALDLAYRCGRLIADAGFVVASGYARGVDMAAHRGALEAGGCTIALVPYGLSRFKLHRDIGEIFDSGRFLAVSELEPWQVFTAHHALRRNKLLAALSRAVIVIEPGESGGSWYSAQKAAELRRPLFFIEGERPEMVGRLELLGGGRIEVRGGTPDLGEVLGAMG